MTRKCTNFLAILFLALALAAGAPAQSPLLSPERVLVLVAGPSGDRISPTEQGVLDRLNALRGELGLPQLKLGTMHFDRPEEARFLKQNLGISPNQGVSVALIELDQNGQPFRKLYSVPNVTPQAIDAAQDEILQQWSTLTGTTLPNLANPVPRPTRTPREVYTPEGILNISIEAEKRTVDLWDRVKNQSLRSDGKDVPVRQHLRGLAEISRNLRLALAGGQSNPKEIYEQLFQVRQAFEESDPQYFLPVELRKEIEPVYQILNQLEETYVQLNPVP